MVARLLAWIIVREVVLLHALVVVAGVLHKVLALTVHLHVAVDVVAVQRVLLVQVVPIVALLHVKEHVHQLAKEQQREIMMESHHLMDM